MVKTLFARITQALLYVLVVLCIGTLAALPFLLDDMLIWMTDSFAAAGGYRTFILIFLEISGLGGLAILIDLIRVFDTLGGDPFIVRNIRALKRMGIVALALTLLFVLKCFLYFTLMTVACALVLLLCGLFSIVLSGVFAQAVKFKQENDLTI